jgi:hypothetical protein
MNKSTSHLSILLAGLLAAAAVQAQTAPAGSSTDLPPQAGEASTQTRGVPNMATTNSPVTEAPIVDKDQVRQDAQGLSSASVSTPVPGKAGEASTMVQGRPNAMPEQHNMARSRADVVNELLQRRSMYEAARRNAQAMGYTGAVGPQ